MSKIRLRVVFRLIRSDPLVQMKVASHAVGVEAERTETFSLG